MTLRERIARKLHAQFCHPDRFDEDAEDWLSLVDEILTEMRGDPGHDVTAAVVQSGQDRTDALNIWNGMLTAAIAERDA